MISIIYHKVHCLNKYWKRKYLRVRRQFSGCIACYTRMRIGIQILSTHMNAGRIWWPSCSPHARETMTGEPQNKLAHKISKLVRFVFKQKTMSQCTRWWVTKQDIWWQLFTSSHGHTHIHMCPHICKHTDTHLHVYIYMQAFTHTGINANRYSINRLLEQQCVDD